ncbi:MAG: class I SAM-dependent methyltransferase [Candidatus Hydrothermales bacterium]
MNKKIYEFLVSLREKSINSGIMALPEESARFLYFITNIYSREKVKIVEFGSGFLYSVLWMLCGILDSGKRGKIYAVEKDEEYFRESLNIASEFSKILNLNIFEILNIVNRDAADLKGNEFGNDIDIVFLDVDKKLYFNTLKKFEPFIKRGGLILAHNVFSHKEELIDFIEEIENPEKYFTLMLQTDPQGLSISIKL